MARPFDKRRMRCLRLRDSTWESAEIVCQRLPARSKAQAIAIALEFVILMLDPGGKDADALELHSRLTLCAIRLKEFDRR